MGLGIVPGLPMEGTCETSLGGRGLQLTEVRCTSRGVHCIGESMPGTPGELRDADGREPSEASSWMVSEPSRKGAGGGKRDCGTSSGVVTSGVRCLSTLVPCKNLSVVASGRGRPDSENGSSNLMFNSVNLGTYQKILPSPIRLSTPSLPLLRVTICRTSASPRPDPLPPCFWPISVCTNGEKSPSSAISLALRPTPVS